MLSASSSISLSSFTLKGWFWNVYSSLNASFWLYTACLKVINAVDVSSGIIANAEAVTKRLMVFVLILHLTLYYSYCCTSLNFFYSNRYSNKKDEPTHWINEWIRQSKTLVSLISAVLLHILHIIAYYKATIWCKNDVKPSSSVYCWLHFQSAKSLFLRSIISSVFSR